jgi:hypothetical protein
MPFKHLHKNLFAQDENEVTTSDFLQGVVKDYPYFSSAHFFLLKQTNPDDIGYSKIAAKTALHINNPFLLNELLQFARKSDSELYDENILVSQLPKVILEVGDKSAGEKVENSTKTITGSTPANSNRMKFGDKIQPSEDEFELPLFEPLFATDYFASQGIKFKEDVLPTDKLGKQLKSFTEWLKTMKKVNESKLSGTNESSENSMQLFAEKSNQDQQVLTETMAEILIKQGKINKAKEIYLKLSLLNPSKNAYFATKIEQIK